MVDMFNLVFRLWFYSIYYFTTVCYSMNAWYKMYKTWFITSFGLRFQNMWKISFEHQIFGFFQKEILLECLLKLYKVDNKIVDSGQFQNQMNRISKTQI